MVAEDLLYFKQIDASFNQMGGIAVTQAVWRNLFFNPHCAVTLRKVSCTPPRSNGETARDAALRPP